MLIVVLALALVGCGGREQNAGEAGATQTIEPAKPQPEATGTDAMTQTVDVEAGRSEAEGHGTEAATAPATTAGTTAATATTATVAPTTST